MANFYKVTKTIGDKEYTAQFNGISASLDAIDNSYIDGTDTTSMLKLTKYLFEHVIVSPKTSINDFGADQIGIEKTREINGKVYKAAFKGMAYSLKAIDESYVDGTNNTSMKKLSNLLLSEIITEPANLTPDSFDSIDEFNEVITFAREVMQGGDVVKEFNEVIAFAREVMQGNFRDKAVKASTGKKSAK